MQHFEFHILKNCTDMHNSAQVYTWSLRHFDQLWHCALQTASHYIALHFATLHWATLHCTAGLTSAGLGRCRRFVGGDFKDGRPVAGSNGAYYTQSWYLLQFSHQIGGVLHPKLIFVTVFTPNRRCTTPRPHICHSFYTSLQIGGVLHPDLIFLSHPVDIYFLSDKKGSPLKG